MNKQDRNKNRILALLLLCLLCVLAACGEHRAPAQATPHVEEEALELLPKEDVEPSSGLIVQESIAYAFEGMIYGGITYKNTGSQNMLLEEAEFIFSYEGGSIQEKLKPFAGDRDILKPGDIAAFTAFIPIEGLKAGSEVSLLAQARGEAFEDMPLSLSVKDARIIQNYPFATLSGRLENTSDQESAMNMVYVRFYDKENALLAIWYFPYNARLQPGQSISFVVHMRSLMIEGLSENTARMEFRAYGI